MPYTGEAGLYKLCREASSLYRAEVVNNGKRYERYVEDFLNSHTYHDAIDAKSKNDHCKNMGIMKSLLFYHQDLVGRAFTQQSLTDEQISELFKEIDCGRYSVGSNHEESSVKANITEGFQCSLSSDQISAIKNCINECNIFTEKVTYNDVVAFFSCNISKTFTSNNNRWLSLFFEGLSKASIITRNWKVVIERNNLILRPSGKGFIRSTDLYSALSQANNKMTSSNEKKIIEYLGYIYNPSHEPMTKSNEPLG